MSTCKADFDMWKLGDWRAKWHVDNFVTQWHIHLLVFWQCVKALLFADKVRTCIDMNAQNNRGDTPLHLASKWGYGEKRFHLNPLYEPSILSSVTEIWNIRWMYWISIAMYFEFFFKKNPSFKRCWIIMHELTSRTARNRPLAMWPRMPTYRRCSSNMIQCH